MPDGRLQIVNLLPISHLNLQSFTNIGDALAPDRDTMKKLMG